MTSVLDHRGPDGAGSYIHANLGLGHRRLAIIDLETGQQPQVTEDGNHVIVYNGEIYNYLEIRRELEREGSRFRTKSDTEVLLEAYRRWGSGCVTHFNGMWAFAIWDRSSNLLFCSRDRSGEKPFYYAMTEEAFVFGSEIKALFAYGVQKVLDAEQLDLYLALSYIPAPWTGFKGVRKLPPACSLNVREGNLAITRYWNLPMIPEGDRRRDTGRVVEEFSSLFADSVRIRMRSDVPFGAFLSSGVDSASVVAEMAKQSPFPVKTCTVGFPPPFADEREGARTISRQFATSHTEREVTAEDADAIVDTLAWHYDEPFGDSSALPTFLISKIAREEVKMVLTGDGGDEVLVGYAIFQGEKFAGQFHSLPLAFRWTAERIVGSLWGDSRLFRTIQSSGHTFGERLLQKQVGFPAAARRRLLQNIPGVRPAEDIIRELLHPAAAASPMDQLNYWLFHFSLPDDMLCKVDRASMAAGLETRAPFLDHRLIELLSSAHWAVRFPGYTRKYILKQAMRLVLPPATLNGKKRGFNLPAGHLIHPAGAHHIRERARLCGTKGILNEYAIREFLDNAAIPPRNADTKLWLLAMLSYCG